MKKTNVDFSKHEVEVIKYNGVIIHRFKIPNTYRNSVTFINTEGVMTVTGDFGNWVFNREFVPSAENDGVSRGYWDEKLQTASHQTSHEFDYEETLNAINDFIENYEESYGQPMSEEVSDWLEELERNADDKVVYESIAYNDTPSNIDFEDIPYGKKRHTWLEIVYDAFEALCEKLKEKE